MLSNRGCAASCRSTLPTRHLACWVVLHHAVVAGFVGCAFIGRLVCYSFQQPSIPCWLSWQVLTLSLLIVEGAVSSPSSSPDLGSNPAICLFFSFFLLFAFFPLPFSLIRGIESESISCFSSFRDVGYWYKHLRRAMTDLLSTSLSE